MERMTSEPGRHDTNQTDEEVKEYWTPERMRDAIPAPHAPSPGTPAEPSQDDGRSGDGEPS